MWIKSVFFVVNEFWCCLGLSFEEYCWLDWFCVMFVKGNVGLSKEMLSKFFQNLCSCFRYRLSYNYPNEVILIGKEP